MTKRMYCYGVAVALLAATLVCASAFAQTYPAKPIRLIVPYPPGGLDASSEQGSRLRDATVRESAADAVLIAQASIPREQYPIRPIRLIVPYPPGGGTDFVARIVALKLPEVIGENVVVDNRAGAAGLVGTELAARAPADGYTLLLVDSSLPINVSYYKNAKYDAIKDFDPITDVADTPYLLVVQPGSAYQSVRDVINAAKAQPGKINFGSGGNGSGSHLTGEFFQMRTGVKLTHVPYKGVGIALTDVIAGQIQTTFTSAPPAMGLIKSGRIKAIAVATEKRIASLPDVPTFGEQGVKDVVVINWYGIASVGGTPKPVLDKLHAALLRVIAMPDVKERFASGALEPAPMSQAAFRKLIAEELTRWAAVIRNAGIKPE